MKIRLILTITALLTLILPTTSQTVLPKREFRGAWIAAVNGQFQGMTQREMKTALTKRLDALRKAGINAVIFQVRAESDALYQSDYEPWSRFLTGTQGRNPGWDPMQFMIEQCHKRSMEFHAWINPYRAKTKATSALSPAHPYIQHPENFLWYGGQIFYDPALPENRDHICTIVNDIVSRYDIDGLHMDDYFYPYPAPGEEFPDEASFARYGRGYTDKDQWRRDNVSMLIRDIHKTVRQAKPWVKFGVSPFGIYRNKGTWQGGSDTRGLQCYDDLYADVLLWASNGWIDYCIPQVYWQIGHPAADYKTLVEWWSKHLYNRPLYIGQDVMRTVKHADQSNPHFHQMNAKFKIQRAAPNVEGSCLWYAKAVEDNAGNYLNLLHERYHRHPAIPPVMKFIDHKAPRRPRKLKAIWTEDGYILFWTAPRAKKEMDKAVNYVVYRFKKGEKTDIGNPSKIIAITPENYLKLPYDQGKKKYKYIITSLDRLHNESKPSKKTIKL